jgi:hypothetical protein
VQTIRNNFIQPTVNAFGYVLDGLTIRWVAGAVSPRPAASGAASG